MKPYRVEFRAEDPRSVGPNTRLIVDGQDITQFTSGVTFTAQADGITQADITLSGPQLDLAMSAEVHLHVSVELGYVLIEQPQADGGKRWRVERESANARAEAYHPAFQED